MLLCGVVDSRLPISFSVSLSKLLRDFTIIICDGIPIVGVDEVVAGDWSGIYSGTSSYHIFGSSKGTCG